MDTYSLNRESPSQVTPFLIFICHGVQDSTIRRGTLEAQSGSVSGQASPAGRAPLCFPVSVLDRADNPRRLVYDVTTAPTWIRLPIHAPSRSTACPTEDSGSVRLSFPLHPLESQSPRWGTCFALAPRGQELHLFEDQVIKDASFFLLSRPRSRSPAPSLFTGNGSHQQLIANAVQRGIGVTGVDYPPSYRDNDR